MNGLTQLVGILGWPVAHSKSPAMHNAAFKSLNLNWAYVPLPVRDDLASAFKGLATCCFRGANVTVPHKEEAARLVDTISDDAKAIGAVNTLVFHPDGTIHGENTDTPGFLAHLEAEKIDIKGQRVAVLGAGGAARGIIFALLRGGASDVVVINRTEARGQELADTFGVRALSWGEEAFEQAAQAKLVVNTTSLGLHESDVMPWPADSRFASSQVVYDAIYRHTPFLRKAHADGARAISGAGMLLWQGALAFEIWTGVKAPIAVMQQELQNA
jgi:shikimate dehydrogenase